MSAPSFRSSFLTHDESQSAAFLRVMALAPRLALSPPTVEALGGDTATSARTGSRPPRVSVIVRGHGAVTLEVAGLRTGRARARVELRG